MSHLKPKDLLDRKRRKLFTERTDKISKEIIELSKSFPEFGVITVSASGDGYSTAIISDDNFIYSRTHSNKWHPTWEVTVRSDADALAKEAANA